jgi:hypothetical protein
MIELIQVPTKEQLAPLVEQMLEIADRDTLVQRHVSGIAAILRNTPLAYRNYGVWWWGIKDLLERHDYDFGDDQERPTLSRFSYDDDIYLLAAAWAYQQHIIDNGYLHLQVHKFEVDSDEYNEVEYSLEDTDLEAMTIG